MTHLSLEPSHHSRMHMIALGTSLNAEAEHLLEAAVCQAQEAHGQHILLDLQALTKIDSRGLGKLFLTYHHLNRQNIRLSMVNPRPMVLEMLEFVNFSKLVKIYGSMEEVVGQEYEVIEPAGLHTNTLN